jgi:protein SHQ1
MLTPCFEVAQDDAFVIITMRVPFVKASEAEFFIDGCSFKFYCKPYFLRLCLPGELVEDGRERAVHNIEKGTITVYVPKRSTGHHFDNLGMITSLLSKKPAAAKMASKPLIEVLPGGGEVAVSSEMEEEEFDWQVDQQVPLDENEELHLDKYSSFYGFADQHKGVFSKLQHELPALVDCPDPDHMTSHERRVARLAHEEASFSPDHYLADLMESTEMIEYLCQFRPAWCQQLTAWKEMKSQKKELREPNQDISE